MIALIKKLFPDLQISKEQETQLEAELGKSFKPLADFNKLETEVATIKEQLDTASETLKSFEGQDIEKIQQTAKGWEEKYNKETADLQAKLSQIQTDAAAEKFLSVFKLDNKICN